LLGDDPEQAEIVPASGRSAAAASEPRRKLRRSSRAFSWVIVGCLS
jgi:hypothetical protein